VVVGEREVVLGIEPAVVGSAEGLEGATFDHGVSPVFVVAMERL
jgi:hypothetical protein